MTNSILLGMACEYTRKLEPCSDLSGFDQTSAMKAVLHWLAANVTDDMAVAGVKIYEPYFVKDCDDIIDMKRAISAALRAAAGESTLSTTGDENA